MGRVGGFGGSSRGESPEKDALFRIPPTPAFGITISRREDVHASVALKAANCASQEVVSVWMNLTLQVSGISSILTWMVAYSGAWDTTRATYL